MEYSTLGIYAVIGVAGVVALGWLITRWIRFVPNGKLALLENTIKGKAIETGRLLARDNEIGTLRTYFKQGWHFVGWPNRRIKEMVAITIVPDGKLAVVTALDGKPLPAGRNFADDVAGDKHDNFQDVNGFMENGGIVGVQLKLLTAGAKFVHPRQFRVDTIERTVVPEGQVGLVYARDGKPLRTEKGQILGDKVDGHDRFQNAAAFITAGGQQGRQIELLPPGVYNINTAVFEVKTVLATDVPKGKVGIVIAKIGKPLPAGEVCATTPPSESNIFADAQQFVTLGGFAGPQDRVLGAGRYYINTDAFEVEMIALYEVQPGFVAARISYTGVEPVAKSDPPTSTHLDGAATDAAEHRLNTGGRALHVVNRGERGLQSEVMQPAKYAINPYAEKVIPWPTSARTVEWAGAKEDAKTNYFDPFEVVSNDGFEMSVEVRVNYRVLPENVPYVISKLGDLEALEANVIHPQVDGIFRAQVSKSPALNYMQKRAEEAASALVEVQNALREYRIEVIAVLITNIKLPKDLMDTQSAKNLAQQKTDMYTTQQTAEKARVLLENTKAEADTQKSIRVAEAGIVIAKNEALAAKEKASGEAARIEAVGVAEAGATKVKGEAAAAVIAATGTAEAEAYTKKSAALGQGNVAQIEVARVLVGIKVPIVPQISTGGGNGSGSSIADTIGAMFLPRVMENAGIAATAKPADAPAPEAPASDEAAAPSPAPTAAPAVVPEAAPAVVSGPAKPVGK